MPPRPPRPDERLDDAFSAQRRARRTAENVRWVQAQAAAAQPEPQASGRSPEPTAEEAARRAEGAGPGLEVAPRPLSPERRLLGPELMLVGGARDAIVEAGQFLESLGDQLRPHLPQALRGKARVALPEVEAPANLPEALVRSGAQFLTGFLPAAKALKAAGLAGGTVKAAARVAAANAAADAVVFDPRDPRASNLLNELAPELRTPITDYLAADPDDSDAEGRLKNVLEGLGFDVTVGVGAGLVRVAKAMRAVQVADGAEGVAKAAAGAPAPTPGLDVIEDPAATLRGGPTGEARPVGPPEGPLTEPIPGTEPTTRRPSDRPGGGEPPIRPPAGGAAANEAVQVVKPRSPDEIKALLAEDPSAIVVGERAFKVNWAKLGGDQIDATLDRITKVHAGEIEAARRGTIGDAALKQLAEALDEPVETLLTQPPGTVVNAERMLALVDALNSATRQLDDLRVRVKAGDETAKALLHPTAEAVVALTVRTQAGFSELGRGLRVGRLKPADLKASQAAVQRLTGIAGENLRQLTPEALADVLEDLTQQEAAKVLKEAVRPNFLDMVLEYRYGAMLSGIRTQVRNFAGNIAMTLGAIPERQLAAWLHFGPTPGVVHGEARAMLAALTNSTVDAFRLARRAFQTGETSMGVFQTEARHAAAITAEHVAALGGAGRLAEVPAIGHAIDLLGAAVRTPGRGMGAMDEFFKVLNFRMELHAQAVREATREGLTGEAFAKRVGEIVADVERFPEIKANAEAFAAYQTFTSDLGPIAAAVQRLRTLDHPAALVFKIALPFYRTPVNIYKAMGERTLLPGLAALGEGVLRKGFPALEMTGTQIYQDLMRGGVGRDLALARMTLGSIVLGTAATLAAAGAITGRGPTDPAIRLNWQRAGWQPYSIRVGESWVSYQPTEPVGSIFGMGADFVSLMANAPDDEAHLALLDDLAQAYVLAISQGMNAKSFLRGPAEILDAIVTGRRPAGGFVGDFLGSMVPVLATDVARAYDPVRRDVQSATDEVFARTPGFSTRVPAQINPLTGEEEVYGGAWGPDFGNPFWTRTPSGDPVLEAVARLNLRLAKPRPAIAGVPLEPAEYRRYQILAGRGFYDLATDEVTAPGWAMESEDGQAALLERAFRQARREAVLDLRDEFPDLDDRLLAFGDERLDALLGPPGTPRHQPREGLRFR